MAERGDITVNWGLSPRIITVAAPSVEITIQDLHDTLRALEDELDNLDDGALISSAGKEELGGGVTVGITATLQNAQLSFEPRITSLESGTVTTADSNGKTLIDSTALFESSGVSRGSTVFNITDGSKATVLEVISETELFTAGLVGGSDNQFDISDAYDVFPTVQCNITGGNLVAVDSLGAELDPVFPSFGTQVVRTSSSSATLQELEAIQYSSYQNAVWLDTGSGNSGTEYPIGTREVPVNNFTDALLIGANVGLSTIHLLSNLSVPSGVDFSGFTIEGENRTVTSLDVAEDATCSNCKFKELLLSGSLDNNSAVFDCVLAGITLFNGYVQNSLLNGVTIILGGGLPTIMKDCATNIDTSGIPTIDCGGSGQALALRGYVGDLKLTNKTGTDTTSLDILSGKLTIDSTVTTGTIYVRGVVELVNNSTGATIEMDSIVLPEDAYDNGEVHIDTVNGTSGQIYPYGTITYPVATISDAMAIATRYGLNAFAFQGTLIADRDFQGYRFRGIGPVLSNILVLGGYNYTNTTFYRMVLTGSMQGTNHQFEESFLNNVSGFSGLLSEVGFIGTVTLGGDTYGRTIQMVDNPNYLDFSSAPTSLFQVSVESGPLEILNLGPGNLCAVSYNNGSITISASCTGGTLIVGGSGIIRDNSEGAVTIIDNTLLYEIPFLVWDEPLTGQNHAVPTTAGRRLRELGGQIIVTGTSQGPAVNGNQIILDTDASAVDGAYDPALIAIVNGTGVGQTRGILDYNGTNKVATVDRTWKVLPDDTSEYIIYAWPGREHVNEGLAQAGTLNTVTLNTEASSYDDAYIGQTIFIRSGGGADQSRQVIAYDGTTKIAIVNENWKVIPDSTSGYVMLGMHNHTLEEMYGYYAAPGFTIGEAIVAIKRLTKNKVTKEDNVITIYEEDGETIWKKYDLSDGGRVETA